MPPVRQASLVFHRAAYSLGYCVIILVEFASSEPVPGLNDGTLQLAFVDLRQVSDVKADVGHVNSVRAWYLGILLICYSHKMSIKKDVRQTCYVYHVLCVCLCSVN